MKRRVGVTALVCATTAAIALPAAASAATKTVYAGNPPTTKAIAMRLLGAKGLKALAKYQPGANAFVNQTVTIHTGDSVQWIGMAKGFHTVDLPGATGKDLQLFLPGATVTGAKDAAGSPFWFDGHVPSLGFNPQLFAPITGLTYDGSKRIDSGLPISPSSSNTLKVKFTKPGTYKYFCDVHPGMFGYVVVKAKGKKVPSAKQDAAAQVQTVTTDILDAKSALAKRLPKNHVSLGLSTPGGLELYGMFPATLRVKTGTAVTFSMSTTTHEVHTATFGPAPYLTALANSLNSPAFNQAAIYPSSPPGTGPILLGTTSHGNGFASTGALDRDPKTQLPPSGVIKFTAPGVYHFECMIHSFMQGTVVVTK